MMATGDATSRSGAGDVTGDGTGDATHIMSSVEHHKNSIQILKPIVPHCTFDGAGIIVQ